MTPNTNEERNRGPAGTAGSLLQPFARHLPILAGIAIVSIVGASLSPFFLTEANLRNIVITGSVVSVLAVGQFIVIVTAGIDLSVGAVAALATVVSAVLMSHDVSPLIAIAVTLAVCGLAGAINGFLVIHAGITPFIATLGMLGIAQGFAYLIQNGTFIVIDDAWFIGFFSGETAGLPNQVIIFVVIMAVFGAIMRWTAFGRQLYAIGGNAEAARLSGLPVKKNVVAAYSISGLLAGIAGLMLAAQLGEGSSLLGQGLELDAIAAAVVGGASLFGGLGTPVSAVIGGLLIGTISNIMNLRGIAAEPQLIIKGALILLAVYLTSGRGGDVRRRLQGLLGSVQPGRPPQNGSGPGSGAPLSAREQVATSADASDRDDSERVASGSEKSERAGSPPA